MNSMNGLLTVGGIFLSLTTMSNVVNVVDGSWGSRGKYSSKWTPSPTPYPTEEGEDDDCYSQGGYWTQYYNRDNPNNYGDDERVYKYRLDGNNLCNGLTPIDIECIPLEDDIYDTFEEYEREYGSSYDLFYCTPSKGFRCKGYNCPDFGVKFCCPTQDDTDDKDDSDGSKRSSSSSSSSSDNDRDGGSSSSSKKGSNSKD